MTPTPKGIRPLGLSLFILTAVLFSLPGFSLGANSFLYITPSTSVTYTLPASKPVTIQAMAVTGLDQTFNNLVTVGLYDTVTGIPSDSNASFVTQGGSPVTGTAPLKFVNGVLAFSVNFQQGSDSEQVSIGDASITAGASGPGTIGNAAGNKIVVTGFSDSYFPNSPGGNVSNPYPTGDTLVDSSSAIGLVGVTSWVTVSNAGAVSGTTGINYAASSYSISNITSGYAFGNAQATVKLRFKKSSNSTNPVILYQVILDYNGDLADFNNPLVSGPVSLQDSVFQGSISNENNSSGTNASALTFLAGAPFQPNMNAGQVILRVWGGSASNPVFMTYNDASIGSLSQISIPYSSLNALPVKGEISPVNVLSGGTTTFTYILKNNYSSPVDYISVQIPANNPVTGTSWAVTSIAPANFHGGSGASNSVLSNPIGSSPGTIVVNTGLGSPIAVGESVTLTLGVSNSDESQTGWLFNPIQVFTATGLPAPADQTGPSVKTQGIPSPPTSFAGAPINFTTAGNSVSLGWGVPVTPEGSVSFVVSSRLTTVGGPYSNPVTIPYSQLSYTDNTALNQTSYDYTVVALNDVIQGFAANVTGIVPFRNPGPPTGVTALSGATSVVLNWTAPVSVAGSFPVTGYQIWRDTSPGMGTAVSIAAVGSTTYSNTGLTPGTTYYYAISSMDNQYAGGAPGGAHDSILSSPSVSGFPPGNPPTGLTGTLLSSSPGIIGLNWTIPTNNINAPIDYQIYKALSPGSVTFYTTVGSAATTFTDNSGLAQGSSYRYMVKAVDSLGVTTNASTTILQSVGPSPPGTPTPTSYASSITLVWTANPAPQGVVSYRVYQNGVPIGTPVPATSGLVTAGVPVSGSTLQGTNYFYQVTAVDGTPVTSQLSTGVSAALLPLAPVILSVVSDPVTTTTMAITWATPVPAEVNLTNYRLDQKILPGSFAPVTTLSSLVFNFGVTTLTSASAGKTIVYQLLSQNIGGFGPASLPVTVQVPPNPVTISGTSSTATNITINWVDATAATEAVTQYRILRDLVQIGTAALGTNSYIDGTGLTTGQNYVYTVKAVNGGGDSVASNQVTAALLLGSPGTFSAVVQANNTSVDLSWAAPAPSTGLTSYNLYRNTSPVLPGAPFTNVSNVTTTFTDSSPTTALAGTVFYYFVEPVNIAGPGANASASVQLPPNAPKGLAATSSSVAVTLSWTSAPGAEAISNFVVHRVDLAGPVTAAPQTIPVTTTYFDTTAQSGHDYYYFINALNPGGTSLPSGNVTMGLRPQAPTGLKAVSVDTSNNIPVTWDSVLTADPNATAVYLLVNDSNSAIGAVTVNLGSPAAVTYFDNGIKSGSVTGESPDTTYYYFLQAANTYGVGALSVPDSKLTYPAPVTLNSVNAVAGGLRALDWTTVGSDVIKYVVYRELQGTSSFVSMGTISTPVNMPVTVSNPILPGKTYLYRITAINATGEGSSATTITFGSAPTAPSSVTAVSGLSTAGVSISLSWADPTAASEGVTGYRVYRAYDNASTVSYTPIVIGNAPLNFLDTAVTATGLYYYVVTAESNNGRESNWSTASAVSVTAFAAPDVPTGVAAVAGNAQATVSWLAPSATTYPVSIYNVYRVSGGVTTLANPATTAILSLVDTGLTNSLTYSYAVRTVDDHGNLSAYSAPSGTVIPVVSPNPPTAMGVVNGDKAVQVSWTPAAPGTLPIGSYIIFRRSPTGVGAFAPITQIAGNLNGFVDNDNGLGLTNLATYDYMVQAVDSTGITFNPHVSANSTTVTGTPVAAKINPPNSVIGNAGNGSFGITWVDSYTPGAAVTGYGVLRSSTGAAGAYVSIGSVLSGVQTYTDLTVANGTTYYYYLVAIDNSASPVLSSGSATVFGTPVAPPLAPTPITVADGNASATLNWTVSSGSGSVTIANYVIYRAIPPGTAPVTLGPTTGPVITFTNTGLANGTPVEYFVSAVNSNGTTGVLSSPVTAFPYDLTAPVVSSQSSGTGVALTWTVPGTNSYPPVVTYNVYRSAASGVYLSAPLTTLAGTSAIDTTGTLGQLYYYVVTATDNQGHVSPASVEIFDGTATPPGPPTNVTVTQGSTELLVDWSAPASIAGNLPVSFYIVTRTSGGPVTLPASQTWYLDYPLVDPSTVIYTITAVDAAGPAQTDPAHQGTSAPGTGTTDDTALNPPSGLTATTTGSASIQLTWVPADDLGRPVQSYAIYRSNSLPVPTISPLVVITNPIAGPVTSYSDTGLSSNTTYYYVLQSVEAGTLIHSGNSNHAVATTIKPSTPLVPVTVGQLGLDANVFLPLTGQKLGIYYDIPTTGVVEIDIYNVAGKQIATLVPGVTAANTAQSVFWDGKDRNGNLVASGLYIVEIRAVGFHQLKKVAVVK